MAFDPSPQVVKPQDSALPEVPQKYAPGELTAAEGSEPEYGWRNERLPQHYQEVGRRLVQLIAQTDQFARIEEVKKATLRRFYWRSMFTIYFNEGKNLWDTFDSVGNSDSGDIPLTYPFNIFQAYGRAFISQVGVVPSVKMEASNPSDPYAARVSISADAMKRHIEFQNDVDVFAEEAARLFWTDGCTCFYSRWVCDGSRFGYDPPQEPEETPEGLGEGGDPPPKQPRKPRGGAMVTPYGVLETKRPINMRDRGDFPFMQLSFEVDMGTAKSMYPWISKAIEGGEPGPGEYNFDRTSRISCTQGIRLLTQSGDTVAQLPTWSRTWIRPCYYVNVDNEEDRQFIQDNFPDGWMIAFIGNTYAESRNESMDDHWEICHPIQGDGQATPAAGELMMAVQDAFNDCTDLHMEYLMKAIPAVVMDKGTFDLAALSKQKAGPGAHWPTKRQLEPGERMQDKVWTEPKMEPPQFSMGFYGMLLNDIPQNLTGLTAATIGDSDPSNETKGGILALRDASRGQQGVAWKSFRRSYARSLEQMVRIEAYYKQGDATDGTLKLSTPGHQEVEVDLNDLRPGSFYCVPDGDESFPRTHEDEQQSFQQLVQAAVAGSPIAAQILAEPKNAPIIKDIISVPGLVIPGADETVKQLDEIGQLLKESPVPNQPAIQAYKMSILTAATLGQQIPPAPDEEAFLLPSVTIQRFDNDQVEFQAGVDWVNSQDGQTARRDNPKGFQNVELHLMAHNDRLQKKQQQAAQLKVMAEAAPEALKVQARAAADTKHPSETINFKDLGPSGQFQVGKQAGLDLSADASRKIVQDHTQASTPQPPQAPPNGKPKSAPPVQ